MCPPFAPPRLRTCHLRELQLPRKLLLAVSVSQAVLRASLNTAMLGICRQREVKRASENRSLHLPPESTASLDSRPPDLNDDGELANELPGGAPCCTRSILRICSQSLSVIVSMIAACDVEESDIFDCSTFFAWEVPRSTLFLYVCGGRALDPLSAVS